MRKCHGKNYKQGKVCVGRGIKRAGRGFSGVKLQYAGRNGVEGQFRGLHETARSCLLRASWPGVIEEEGTERGRGTFLSCEKKIYNNKQAQYRGNRRLRA